MSAAEAVWQTWSAYAGREADAFDELLVPPVLVPAAEILVDAGRLQPGERVLDLACGSGAVAEVALDRLGAKGEVVGVDFDEAMLGRARLRLPTAELIQADAIEIPEPDSSFDVVLCQQGLQFFPDREAAVAETIRLLRPGGRVLVSVWCPVEAMPGLLAVRETLRAHVGEDVATQFFRHSRKVGGGDGLRRLLDRNELADVKVERRTYVAGFDSGADFLTRYGAQSSLPEQLGELDAERRTAAIEDALSRLAGLERGGRLRIEMCFDMARATRRPDLN